MTHETPHALLDLVSLSRDLGDPSADLVILGEGNTSLQDGADMLVKASGAAMATVTPSDFVRMRVADVLDLITDRAAGEIDVDRLFSAVQDRHDGRRPSVEALLHAVCLEVDEVRAAGHTHPIAVNAILCSVNAPLLTQGSLFPDQIVVLGTEPLLVEYVDPGLALARVVRDKLVRYVDDHGHAPKVIYLRNHGMFALGASAHEVRQITAMAVKCARVLQAAVAFGGVRFMPKHEVDRINTRPDEIFRRQRLAESPGDARSVPPMAMREGAS
ncbi:class II aldolase/adducin family protein [Okibacterium endophyticum]